MKQRTLKSASNEHEAVYHAARCCQAAALSLTASRLRGRKQACSLESQKTAGFLAAQGCAGVTPVPRKELCGEPGMSLLCRLKGRSVIAGMVEPHRVEDAHPPIGQGSHRHGVAFAFCSLALIVGQGPGFFQGRLPGELIEGIAQGLQAGIACMRFGVIAALEGDRSRSSQGLQASRISIAAAIVADGGQQPWCQSLAGPGQTAEDLVVFMAQKKARDLLVILSNLLHQRQELAHQGQHQTRFGAGGDRISSQLGLVQSLDNMLCRLRGIAMVHFLEHRCNLGLRSGLGCLGSGIGLQEDQRRALVQLGEQGECRWVVRFEAGGQLVDQARLTLDQAILIAGQQLEFSDQRGIRSQLAQVRQLRASGLGQQIGIHCIGFQPGGIAPAIDGLGIERRDDEAGLKPRGHEQALRGFHDTGQLIGRLGNVEQEALPLIETCFGVRYSQRSHLASRFIDDQRIMMGISPLDTSKPHGDFSLASKNFLGLSGPSLRVLEAQASHHRVRQEGCQGKHDLPGTVEPRGGESLSPAVLTGQGISLQALGREGLVQL
jgi:hypothetical protein